MCPATVKALLVLHTFMQYMSIRKRDNNIFFITRNMLTSFSIIFFNYLLYIFKLKRNYIFISFSL